MVAINDPLFAQQWHLKMLGNIQRIWDEYTGAGVHVGVFDDGLQFTHPDLDANYDPTRHFSYGGIVYVPTPITLTGADPDAHGTSVAGIIAAEANNGIGGVGVAYGAKLTGINILSDTRLQSDFMMDLTTRYESNFDVSSNSWGYTPNYESYQNASDSASVASNIIGNYDIATQTGRGGLGTVIVQASGNDSYSAQADGLNTARSLISVAALTSAGEVQDYSNYGANIWISAGAAAVTTDLMSFNGYNTSSGPAGNYQTTFGGTSAATPVVSGVAALMLQANPMLGWRDVKEILASSARLTGSIIGGSATNETSVTKFQQIDTLVNGTWQRDGDSWNDGGRAYSSDYGFGAVDAYAAVRLAEVWTLMNGPAQTTANQISVSASNNILSQMSYSFNGTGSALSQVTVNQHLTLDYVSVTLDVRYQNSLISTNSLSITLYSPTGVAFKLVGEGELYYSDVSVVGGLTWKFGVAHGLGLDAMGTWSVRVDDSTAGAAGKSGYLDNVTLDFFGSTYSTNNIHHITQDFLNATTANLRTLNDKAINDSNGGIDWLQMATLAGNIVVSLVPGKAFTVGGIVWGSIDANSVIENVVTGDGNDRITGNAGVNFIYGMRGNDTINGGLGNDKLDGGADNDLLQGADGNDQLIGGFGHDTLIAGNGNDLLVGGVGLDSLLGEGGNDQLNGVGGNDNLDGGAGADRLDGGAGRDILTGGADGDLFVFINLGGSDFVTDFQDNIDTLMLDRALWGGAALSASAVLSAFAVYSSGSILLNFGGGDTITIAGLAGVNALLDDIAFL